VSITSSMPSTGLRLGLVYTALFASVGILLPYFPVWLADRGLTLESIGLLIGVSVALKVIVNPIGAAVADRQGASKPVIITCVVIAFATFLPFTAAVEFWPLLALTILFFGFWSPLFPLIDGISVRATRANKMDYGQVRLWGSLAFIGATIGAGHIIELRGSSIFFTLMVVAILVMVLGCFLLPTERIDRSTPGQSVALSLLRDPRFRLFLCAIAFTQASHATYYGFGTLHWQSLGIDETTIGLFWGWGVIAEVILFAFATRLFKSWTPIGMLIFGAGGAIVRWTIMAFDPPTAATIFGLQTLHALSFGIIQLGSIRYVAEQLPPEKSASAVALLTSATGLAIGASLFAMGHLYAAFDGMAYLGAACLSAVGLVFAALLFIRRQSNP